MDVSRRTFVAPLLAVPALSWLVPPAYAQGPALQPTLGCQVRPGSTPAQTEGPYFRPDAPLKQDLAADVTRGQRIRIGGLVLDTACRPVPDALVQVWHADDAGSYDSRGYRLRGHQFTGADGAWGFSTIVPAPYWPRTRHYHVKVQRPDGPVLTTHLYFPDEARNGSDREYNDRLLLGLTNKGGLAGRFDFIVA